MENEKIKELLTASRMESFLSCPRRHYWRYEIGLQANVDAMALRFGSAWHRAMEARWKNQNADMAFDAGIGNQEFDELTVATFAAMLGAYCKHYGDADRMEIIPEVEFNHEIAGSRTFQAAGKIDGIGILADGRHVLIEHKTTSADVSADSDYWIRLRANHQIYQYVVAARHAGWDIQSIIYDVVRKPAIRPKEVPILDENGAKIVIENETGNRAFNKNGSPRQTGGEGFTVQSRTENAEEFGRRLEEDCLARPEFYFARREVPVLHDDIEEFEYNRVQVARMILDRRRQQARIQAKPERAWPRHCNGMVCPSCQYASFCLQNIGIDPNFPPPGFTVGSIHSELSTSNGEAA
jgi:hypothetical protein